MKNQLFVVSLEGGNMTIVNATTKKKVEKYARHEFGSMVTSIKPAKDEDVSWCASMGGRIHEA